MIDFASLNTNIAEIDDTNLLTGFGKGCDGKAGMPLTSGYFNAVFQYIFRCLVPTGAIVMWRGTADNVPSGWQIISEYEGLVPVGAGDSYPVTSTGGAINPTTTTNGAHDHSGNTGDHTLTIDQIPAHSHGYIDETSEGGAPTNLDGDPPNLPEGSNAINRTTDTTGGGQAHSHKISSGGGHTHTVNVLQPYVAVYYIIKL